MRSLISSSALLVLMAAIVIVIGMSLPLVRHIYEQPVFLAVSFASAALVGILIVVAAVRAGTSKKRKLFCFGLLGVVSALLIIRIYHDHGSPPLFAASPQILSFFRELVHIVEYGLLALLATRILKNQVGGRLLYLTVFAYAFIVGMADEIVQWLHAFRVGDLRDAVTNGVSASLGLLYGAGLRPFPRQKLTPAGRWLASILLVLSPLVFVEFYLRTQTGHWNCDERQNCFISNYTPARLSALAEERAAVWRGAPPGSLAMEKPAFWAWEDLFLTEARAHFRLANEAAAENDAMTACGELQILTHDFAPAVPVLGVRPRDYPCRGDTAGFKSRAFHHLGTETNPSTWRFSGVVAALVLLAAGAVVSRDDSRRNRNPDCARQKTSRWLE